MSAENVAGLRYAGLYVVLDREIDEIGKERSHKIHFSMRKLQNDPWVKKPLYPVC
jgi:hypothetical protein